MPFTHSPSMRPRRGRHCPAGANPRSLPLAVCLPLLTDLETLVLMVTSEPCCLLTEVVFSSFSTWKGLRLWGIVTYFSAMPLIMIQNPCILPFSHAIFWVWAEPLFPPPTSWHSRSLTQPASPLRMLFYSLPHLSNFSATCYAGGSFCV